MLKKLVVAGLCLPLVCSLSAPQKLDRTQGVTPPPDDPGLGVSAAREAPPAEDAAPPGAQLGPVPAELAAHLGPAAERALLVEELEPGSPLAEAGLERFDVIVAVNRGEPDTGLLAASAGAGQGLALLVLRGGVEHRVTVPGTSPVGGDGSFLSTRALDADHPFRRLDAFRALREGYEEKLDEYSRRIQEVDELSRRARQEAKREVAELQRRCEAQVAEYLAAEERELLSLLDERLAADRVAPLRGLAVDLGRRLPAERTEAVGRALQAIHDDLKRGPRDGIEPRLEPLANDLAGRTRQRFAKLGDEQARAFDERVERPWAECVRDARQYTERLGPRHAGHVDWAAATLEQVRVELRERVSCAFRRGREEFSKELADRLDDMEVPAPGEVERCLEDLCAQTEDMTQRFLRRVDGALGLYEREVRASRERLLPALESGLAACEAASGGAGPELAALLDAELGGDTPPLDGSWRTRSRLDDLRYGLRPRLIELVNRGRDALRAGTVPLLTALKEDRRIREDAWDDLRELLGGIRQDAANDCWKLDGPHLDGRFADDLKDRIAAAER